MRTTKKAKNLGDWPANSRVINPQGGKTVIGLKQPNKTEHTIKRQGKSIAVALLLLLSTVGLPGNQQDVVGSVQHLL